MQVLRRTFTPREFRYVAYTALAVCAIIVFSGAAVRVTGSGLGCPDWPRCDGASLTPELSTHSMIEFGNRLMTSVVALPCLLAVWMAWRRRPFRRDLLLIALTLPLGVAAQAVWGGFTVIFDLAPGWVIMHFLLSMLLLVANVALAWRATFEPGARPPARDRLSVWSVRALLPLGFASLTGGTIVTASGPHAGGAGTGDVVERITWHGPGETLSWAIERHSTTGTVLGLAAVAVWFIVRRRDKDPLLMRAMTVVCLLIACQGAVGIVQWQLHLPAGIVWVHVVLATVTWIAILVAASAAGRIRVPAHAPAREPAPAELAAVSTPR
ncbi:COX15/CtaA family protein [Solirubrobacter sp. CPCC 204708]|uniref:COX15/CtaA family protein n=1 Tax=Solirubrobacter deserti TaxID=2282478 RepID=A0ABT4RNF5_9ACTN|nr:COX15/CtaA family protein [Solirubrobacter deserti]MBE2317433.1 COX15/CtaA family protein [Solirubrobacter deserti]MDA0140015.1 COX15/CtaA family protein [Solirubrobacter deserti]